MTAATTHGVRDDTTRHHRRESVTDGTGSAARRIVLAVDELSKVFVLHGLERRIDGLIGVTFDVAAGEHLAVVGTSGAGKSTLLKCIHRTYLPTSGRVQLHVGHDGDATVVDLARLDDRHVAAVRGRHLAYVSQFLPAQPRRCARDIVIAAATRGGHEAPGDGADSMLDRLGLDRSVVDVPVGVLSGGERQRVNLAAGLVAPPPLVLLDEPISALDPANRNAALDAIDQLRTSGTAVVSVLHDRGAIERVATRAARLERGRIVAAGAPADVLDDLEAAP